VAEVEFASQIVAVWFAEERQAPLLYLIEELLVAALSWLAQETALRLGQTGRHGPRGQPQS